MNTAQFIPRASKELQDCPELYHKLQENFEDMFDWQQTKVKKIIFFHCCTKTTLKFLEHLPDSYKKLTGYANCLPGDEFLAGYPFGGIVLNLNIATKIHRDPEDLDLCLIIVISECTGGDLVMFEPGLVLGQRNGDMIAFPSGDISHFNMDFFGFRSSLVFHSDAASESWDWPSRRFNTRNVY